MHRIPRHWLKAFAGLSINMSAGYLGAAILYPSLEKISNIYNLILLILDITFAILFLLISVKIEKEIN